MNHSVVLNEVQLEEIRKLAKEKRRTLGFVGETPIANDIFTILDKQIFAIAHELYHFYTKTGSHLSRPSEEENLVETEANRFAAEFLLPESTLKSIVLGEFKISSLEKKQLKTLLRFIARLQCTWWLPYRSLVKRLKEINCMQLMNEILMVTMAVWVELLMRKYF